MLSTWLERFEEIAHPSMPECTIIFEVGIADAKSFNYVYEEETKRVLNALKKELFWVMGLFASCATIKVKQKRKRL